MKSSHFIGDPSAKGKNLLDRSYPSDDWWPRFLESRFKLLDEEHSVIPSWGRKSVCGEPICTSDASLSHFSHPPFSTSGHSWSPFYYRHLFLRFSRKNQSSLKASSRWSSEIATGGVQLVTDENYLRLDRNSELREWKSA